VLHLIAIIINIHI